MPYDDDPDDEDWYDDDEPDEEESARCPECGGPVHSIADRCPACGYWLTESDRRRIWTKETKPRWITITTIVVLLVLVLSSLVLIF